jgi:hypothetical protein
MSIDEILRTIMYVLLIPGLAYLGVRVWNAVVMPEVLRRPIAVMLWLQSGIYSLFMVGLLALRLWQPLPVLLWVNTAMIASQSLLIVYIGVRVWHNKIKPILSLVMLFVLTILLLG